MSVSVYVLVSVSVFVFVCVIPGQYFWIWQSLSNLLEALSSFEAAKCSTCATLSKYSIHSTQRHTTLVGNIFEERSSIQHLRHNEARRSSETRHFCSIFEASNSFEAAAHSFCGLFLKSPVLSTQRNTLFPKHPVAAKQRVCRVRCCSHES